MYGGYTQSSTQGIISDGITSILGDLKSWDSGYYQGTVLHSEVAGDNLLFGQLCYRAPSGSWSLADAASTGMLGICLADAYISDTTSILVKGFVETSYITGSKEGEPLFISESESGSMNYVAPTSSGKIVRIVGYTFWEKTSQANLKYVLYFNPDNTWIELS
jgi:hypothetical protein